MLAGTPTATPSQSDLSRRRPTFPTTEALTQAPNSPGRCLHGGAEPDPVQASDGKVHVAYELLITNASGSRCGSSTLRRGILATKKTC